MSRQQDSSNIFDDETSRFLTTIFKPKDHVLFRPIETWTDGNRRQSRIISQGICYEQFFVRDEANRWSFAHDRAKTVFSRILNLAAQTRANVFFGVCPRFRGVPSRNSPCFDLAWQIRTVRVLWADLDNCTADDARRRCQKNGLPELSIIVNSGHGVHVYWLLQNPYLIDDVGAPLPVYSDYVETAGSTKRRRYIVDPVSQEEITLDRKADIPEQCRLSPRAQQIQQVLAGVAQKIGGDSTQDLSRLLRLPGTLNRKDQRNGREPVLCQLVEIDENRRYEIGDFEQFARAPKNVSQRQELAVVTPAFRSGLAFAKEDKTQDLIATCAAAEKGTRSEHDFRLCAYAIENGIDGEILWQQVEHVGKFGERGRDYFDRTWQNAETHVRNRRNTIIRQQVLTSTRGGAPNNDDGSFACGKGHDERPYVCITPDEHLVNDQVVEALAADPSVFQRGGNLVRVTHDSGVTKGICRAEDSPFIDIIPLATLRERIAGCVRLVKRSKTADGDEFVPSHPPGWCVQAVGARGEWRNIRQLTGIATCPVLRPDGTVLQSRGYDKPTGLLCIYEGATFTIPAEPSQEDALAARDVLLEVVQDFPYENEIHKAAWLAFLLTPLARHAFYGPSPLFLMDANVRGSGKTLLTDVVAQIVSGREMARMSNPKSDEEARKRITALAIAGDPLILIDNINGSLGSSSLDAALTSTRWKDRILGKSQIVEMPLTPTWCASGNNVVLMADTSRRVVHVRLDSPLERPEQRTDFQNPNLTAWVSKERPRLLTAALTILRAFVVAGRPDQSLKPWGSFQGWSDVVRQSIVWIKMPDPGETRQQLIEQVDRETDWLRQMIEGWEEADPDYKGLAVAEALKRIEQFPESYVKLRSAISELGYTRGGKPPSTRSIGMKLHHMRRRVIGEKCFDRDTQQGTALWFVRKTDAGGTS